MRRIVQLNRLIAAATLGVATALTGCHAPAAVGVGGIETPNHMFTRFAVAADHPVASQAGAEMLRRGGNAVDAAVATSFCLSVVRPYSCGIGGGGFMLIHRPAGNDQPALTTAINYRETCPAGIGPAFYETQNDPAASRFGGAASGVPGTVAGLLHALEKYGRLDRATVLAPAIRAAEEGFAADADHVSAARALADTMARYPRAARLAQEIWSDLCLGGRVRVGDVIRNPAQARALRLIVEQGAEAFYRGEIADAIVQASQNTGGVLTKDDLTGYRVREVQPLRGRFRDMDVLVMPPPSSGGVAMLQMFTMLEARWSDVRMLSPVSAGAIHFYAELMKHAFADRARYLADPAFVPVPIEQLLDRGSLERLAWGISRTWTMQPEAYGTTLGPPDDGGTSHLSVIDAEGMAVACTETINLSYGSLVTVPGFGFALNNEMDDFTTVSGEANAFGLRQSDANRPVPGKRPLSSMSPTIVLRGDRPVAVAGASGGPRIITSTFQCLLHALIHDRTAGEAVGHPRFHHQWMPHRLLLEDRWSDSRLATSLERFGHVVDVTKDVGVVQMVVVRGGVIHAASDPRKGGVPAGE